MTLRFFSSYFYDFLWHAKLSWEFSSYLSAPLASIKLFE